MVRRPWFKTASYADCAGYRAKANIDTITEAMMMIFKISILIAIWFRSLAGMIDILDKWSLTCFAEIS